jgi:hypothetical protein
MKRSNKEAQPHRQDLREIIVRAAGYRSLQKRRYKLASLAAETFSKSGTELHLFGHIIGSDRVGGSSPFGHGNDEAVAVSMLLRIASQLISASSDLFRDGRSYAAAALLRQMVEIEYLAWAIGTGNREGERWLRSDRAVRESFFTPAKLRKAAQGKFRGQDYGYHCELGGHPVPGASVLLDDESAVPQLLLADLLGHVGRIWDYFTAWAARNSHGNPILSRSRQMSERFCSWKSADPLATIPPPP